MFAAVCVILFGSVFLGAELLHAVSGGRIPSLIQCMVESERKHPAILRHEEDREEDEEDENSDLPESARPPYYVVP